jgi:HEPN domain-containing protein
MKTETREWLSKADGDYATASRERLVEDNPNHDVVCFHAQQAAEKYLKARLVEAGIPFPRTHDLEALLGCVLSAEPAWERIRPDLRSLTSMAVEVRYPGTNADAEDANEAHRIAGLVQNAVRRALAVLDGGPPGVP